MKNQLRYGLLRFLKGLTRTVYRHELYWIHREPSPPWNDLRLVAFLNHTSLYEWLFVGLAPNHLLHRVAFHAVIPAADVTLARPAVGPFLKALAPEVLPITRQADHTWEAVLDRVHSERMVLILPEGRMMRANGLDKHGRPMTVRGGIADILLALGSGKMLLAYSGGLHHVQVPGQRTPRLFKTLRIALEMVDIAEYVDSLGASAKHPVAFKRTVIADLEHRRDYYCPQLAPDQPSRAPRLLPPLEVPTTSEEEVPTQA
jgi:1-acyl-sn-glycerol-3-phosphate acyltransferase